MSRGLHAPETWPGPFPILPLMTKPWIPVCSRGNSRSHAPVASTGGHHSGVSNAVKEVHNGSLFRSRLVGDRHIFDMCFDDQRHNNTCRYMRFALPIGPRE